MFCLICFAGSSKRVKVLQFPVGLKSNFFFFFGFVFKIYDVSVKIKHKHYFVILCCDKSLINKPEPEPVVVYFKRDI